LSAYQRKEQDAGVLRQRDKLLQQYIVQINFRKLPNGERLDALPLPISLHKIFLTEFSIEGACDILIGNDVLGDDFECSIIENKHIFEAETIYGFFPFLVVFDGLDEEVYEMP
jgi:hypothetical protein